jgi:hypothetical protein
MGASILSVVICALACTSKPIAMATDQDTGRQIVLALGESGHIPESDLTIVFESVDEDSRCPTGLTCIREGDAAVRLRIEEPGSKPSTLTLHTSGPGAREADVDRVTVRLVDVRPYPAGDRRLQAWGLSTDIPVPGDYDGDGKTGLAAFRPSTGVWYILQSSTNYTTYMALSWGLTGDVPVPGDFDGDGKGDLGIYRPSTGVWYIRLSSTGYTNYTATPWGLSGDLPVLGRR